MPYSVLLVDENQAALKCFDAGASEDMELLYAGSYGEALAKLGKSRDCRVIITDLYLNGENGMDFLDRVNKRFPRVIRMILTSSRKFEDAQAAMNSGVSHYLLKPCDPDEMQLALGQALRKSREERGRRNSLLGSVKALVDILDMVNPDAMGFSKRIRDRVVEAGKDLGFRPIWQLELAVLLSHIGCVALPANIVQKVDRGDPLTPEEKQIFAMHPDIAANLLANIPQMAPIAGIISHQHESLNPGQPLGSRIIKVALDLDRHERAGKAPLDILDKMSVRTKMYDPAVVESMQKFHSHDGQCTVTRALGVEELKEGMIVARDLVNKDGTPLMLRGHRISKASLVRLQSFHVALGILDPVHVFCEE